MLPLLGGPSVGADHPLRRRRSARSSFVDRPCRPGARVGLLEQHAGDGHRLVRHRSADADRRKQIDGVRTKPMIADRRSFLAARRGRSLGTVDSSPAATGSSNTSPSVQARARQGRRREPATSSACCCPRSPPRTRSSRKRIFPPEIQAQRHRAIHVRQATYKALVPREGFVPIIKPTQVDGLVERRRSSFSLAELRDDA